MGNVKPLHDIDAGEVADDGREVWHHAFLAVTQFDEAPTLIAAVEVDEHGWQEDGEEVDQS